MIWLGPSPWSERMIGIVEELLQIRDPLYREIADVVIETDGRKVKSVADEIIEYLS